MKALWILILVPILFLSCEVGGESREAVCRHKAVMAALVYSEYYPVRIAYGHINGEDGYHCQAQVCIGETWYSLTVVPSQVDIVTDEMDDWYTIERYFDLETFIKEVWFNKGFGKQGDIL